LPFSESSELGLRLAFAVGAISLVVAVGLALQVLLMRVRAQRRLREIDALHERWRPLLARAALGESNLGALPALARADRAPLLLLWNQLQDGLRGAAHESLNQLAERLGLHRDARAWAERGRLGRRVIGLATLGHLGQPDDWRALHRALVDPRTLVSVGAARALIQIHPGHAAPAVLEQYLRRPDWPAPRLGTLLRHAGAEAVAPPLNALLLAAPPEQQLRLLPLLRFAESPTSASVVYRLIETSREPRVLSAALRLLHGPEALPRVRALAAHADALVRSAAAVALSQVGGAAERPMLAALMSDRDWWVRYRAAQALLRLPGSDPVVIGALREALQDRYARDMLDHVLAERELELLDASWPGRAAFA
jgi:HEAT repeats